MEIKGNFSVDDIWNGCRYQSCRQCGGCGVCHDFHGDAYGGCNDLTCPYRWYHRVRDWWRRLWL